MSAARMVRRRRLPTHTFESDAPEPSRPLGSGSARILLGFAVVVGLGTALLMLPISAADGEVTHVSDAFFTAISALTVTGLVTLETQAHWSFFGELVLLVLIQAGGLGYMLGVSLVLWAFGRRIGLRDRHLIRQYYGAPTMGETLRFARRIVAFAAITEAIGVVLLFIAFWHSGLGAGTSVWWSVFHSISAFNNAGFNITGADMLPYAEDPLVLFAITALVVTGSIGALPILAISARRSARGLPLDHTLILVFTALLLLVGTVVILALEWSNDATLGAVDPVHRPMLGLFNSAMPRGGGFAAVDTAALHDETRFFIIGLMFIGGAAGSTAGGIKVGAFALLLFVLIATVRGRDDVVAFGRSVPILVIRQALTLALLAVAAVFAVATLIAALTDEPFINVLFESVSALGTVGHSTGLTPGFGHAVRLILIVAMLVGRFGPLLLVLNMTRARRNTSIYRHPEDSIRLG